VPDFSATDQPNGVLIKLGGSSVFVPDQYVDRVIQALYQRVTRAQVQAHLKEHQGLSAEAVLKGEI
jgi:hypothetical protein